MIQLTEYWIKIIYVGGAFISLLAMLLIIFLNIRHSIRKILIHSMLTIYLMICILLSLGNAYRIYGVCLLAFILQSVAFIFLTFAYPNAKRVKKLKSNKLFSDTNSYQREYQVSSSTQEGIGWLGVVFSTFMIALSMIIESHWIGYVVWGVFLLIGIASILSSGSIRISDVRIRYEALIRTYEMSWEEVKSIQVDTNAMSIIFQGIEKRLSIPGPANWSHTHHALIDFIIQKAERLNIAIEQNDLALLKGSKETQIKRNRSRRTSASS